MVEDVPPATFAHGPGRSPGDPDLSDQHEVRVHGILPGVTYLSSCHFSFELRPSRSFCLDVDVPRPPFGARRGLDGPEPVSLPRYLAVRATRPVDHRRRFEGLARHFEVPEVLLDLVVAA